MLRAVLGMACFIVANAATATVYVLEGQPYITIGDFTPPCGTGPCANYNILPLATAFSFSDGVNTYASGDPNVRAYDFAVETDAFGNVLFSQILLEVWESGTSPHAVGDRVSYVVIAGPQSIANNNLLCIEVGAGGSTGTADLCRIPVPEASSTSTALASVTWRRNFYPPVPASSAGGLALLSAVLLTFGIAAARMRRTRHDS